MAVEAYCRELCPPDEAPAATAEALAAFGVKAARLGQKATPSDHERILSRATRLAAASHAVTGPSGSGWRSWVVDTLTAERDVGCRGVPALLARRGNGELAGEGAAALRDHLHGCLRCRATEVRMARAERTFTAASRLGMTPPGVTGQVVRAAAAEPPTVEPAVVDGPVGETAPVAEAAPAGESAPVGENAPVTEAPDADLPAPFADVTEPTTAPDTPWVPPQLAPEPEPFAGPAGADWSAAPVAAAAAAAAATSGATDPPPPAEHFPIRTRRRLGPIPVAAAVGVLAAGGVAAAAVLSSGAAHHAQAQAAPTAAHAPAPAPVATARARHPHRRHVVHHRTHKPKPKPKPVTSTVTSTSLTATGNSGSTGTTGSVGSTGNTGAVAPAPSVSSSAPVASSPPASSGGGSSSGSGSSATIQQPSLGATSAPTQGIGH